MGEGQSEVEEGAYQQRSQTSDDTIERQAENQGPEGLTRKLPSAPPLRGPSADGDTVPLPTVTPEEHGNRDDAEKERGGIRELSTNL